MPLLETERYLDQAEDLYLFLDQEEFYFELRRKSGVVDFYLQIEKELQKQNLFQVVDYREIKEGFTKISRPSRIFLSLSALLKVKPELRILKERINYFHNKYQYISVKDFIKKNKQEVFRNLEITAQCLDVFQYLLINKEKIEGNLVRQIPHGYSTKFIGREKLLLKIFQYWMISLGEIVETTIWKDFFYFYRISKTPIEYRVFASSLSIQNQYLEQFHGVISKINIEQFRFEERSSTLIVENWETFYYLSTLDLPCLLVWGAGWRASLLKPFLPYFPGPFFYWGDIDKEGFEILGYLQNLSVHKITPLFMDEPTLQKFSYLRQNKDKYFGPFKKIDSSQHIYEMVCKNGWQIEQEQIEISKEQILMTLKKC